MILRNHGIFLYRLEFEKRLMTEHTGEIHFRYGV